MMQTQMLTLALALALALGLLSVCRWCSLFAVGCVLHCWCCSAFSCSLASKLAGSSHYDDIVNVNA